MVKPMDRIVLVLNAQGEPLGAYRDMITAIPSVRRAHEGRLDIKEDEASGNVELSNEDGEIVARLVQIAYSHQFLNLRYLDNRHGKDPLSTPRPFIHPKPPNGLRE